ncbi:MAG: hypothetical protein ACRYGF_17250 [Janthinobacterium lividum]
MFPSVSCYEVYVNAQDKRCPWNVLRLAMLAGMFGVGVLSAQCHFGSRATSRQVTYLFVPDVTLESLTLHVTLEFVEGQTGSEKLEIPSQWAGETLKSVSALQVVSAGATLDKEPATSERVVRATPGTPVRITYDLTKDWSGPFKHPLQFHPVLTPRYLEFTGSNALVRLELPDGNTETANFDWSQLPPSCSARSVSSAGNFEYLS